MSKGYPIWEGVELERPSQWLELLAQEAVSRLLELAYREPTCEMADKLRDMVSLEAIRLHNTMMDMEGELYVETMNVLCKLIPILMRTMETRTLLTTESYDELLEAAISEAGLSPKKREDIVALQRLDSA
jgi:hypothetical protein